MELNIGDGRLLNNGGIILNRKKSNNPNVDIVLALYENKFVVWNHDNDTGTCRNGLYCADDLRGACDVYDQES